MEAIPPLLALGAVLSVCLWLMRRPPIQHEAPVEFATTDWQGLVPSASAQDKIIERLRVMEGRPEGQYLIEEGRTGRWGAIPVQFARVTRDPDVETPGLPVLLAPVGRHGDARALYLKPSTFAGQRILGTLSAMAPAGWDHECAGWSPVELNGTSSPDVIGLHVPREQHGHLDRDTLQAVHGAGDAGVYKIILRDGWAMFLMPSPHLPMDLALLRPVVEALATRDQLRTEREPATV